MSDKLIKSGFHWSFGWMRKKSEDCEHGYAYEHPDGDLIWTPRMDHKLVAYLDCFQDHPTLNAFCNLPILPYPFVIDIGKALS